MSISFAEKRQSVLSAENHTCESDKRDKSLDIIKGILIIFMVCGHGHAPFSGFITLFHMAVFFMISGYLWNNKNSSSFKSVLSYAKRKLISLWIPYFVCNVIFILLNNVFIRIGVYATDEAFLQLVTGPRNELAHFFGIKDYFVEIVKSFFMLDVAQLGGALWFLRALFIITVGHALFVFLLSKTKHKNLIYGLFLSICAIGAIVINNVDLIFPEWSHNTTISLVVKISRQLFASYIAYFLGILIRRLKLQNRIKQRKIVLGASAALILFAMTFIGGIDISQGKIKGLLFYIIATLCGWVMMTAVGYALVSFNRISRFFSYIGSHTMCIIMLHLLAFKSVSWAYLAATGSNMILLASFPVLNDSNNYLWIAYTLAGTAIPLLCDFVYRIFKKRILRRKKR